MISRMYEKHGIWLYGKDLAESLLMVRRAIGHWSGQILRLSPILCSACVACLPASHLRAQPDIQKGQCQTTVLPSQRDAANGGAKGPRWLHFQVLLFKKLLEHASTPGVKGTKNRTQTTFVL